MTRAAVRESADQLSKARCSTAISASRSGPAGKKYPVVMPFQGADTMAEATIMGGAAYVARGMAYLAVDFPGQGGALRLKDLHLPPDTDRVAKAMIDYLETRPDVDATEDRHAGNQHGRLRRSARGERANRESARRS